MKRILSVLAAAALMAVVAGPSLAQEAAKKAEAPKAAPSTSQAVLEQWNDIGRKLIAIAEDLPENKYDYKPNPDSRTFRRYCCTFRVPCTTSRIRRRNRSRATRMIPSPQT